MECGFTAKGATEQEVMAQAAEHGKTAHGLATIPSETVAKVKAAIHDESRSCSSCCA